ncbi:DELLA protein 1-like, partial [Vigna umbellata]|uniref:DELLA protein 1-like n=1 Tax=Vigna umbellata TaxID=87088 RepID=UPI001F5EC006
MENDKFSSTALNLRKILVGYGSTQEDMFQEKESFSGMELLGPIEDEKGTKLFEDEDQKQVDKLLEVFNCDYDMQLKPTPQFDETTRPAKHDIESAEHNNHVSPSLASLELLRNYISRFKRISEQNIAKPSLDHHQISTEEIIRVAGARYVQYSAHWNDSFCIPMHPYGLDFGCLSEEENRDVELAQFLLAAAERVGCHQFERASRLLLHCQLNSSPNNGSPVQRVIFHFAQALRERIDRGLGRTTAKGSEKKEERGWIQKIDTNVALTFHQNIPFNQVMQFTGIQTIVEHVASETKIHVIDFETKCGVHNTILMQALTERQDCKVQLLKITALALNSCRSMIQETGKRLASFAESLKLPFSYNAVFVTDFAEIREGDFEIGEGEAVAVYSPYFLRRMVSRPDCMENLMRVIWNMKPVIMIVLEVEANHNSPIFVNRFIEALFFYSAYFDCLGSCINDENESRRKIETVLSEGIREIVAMEGRERKVRNVKIDVWRKFFARYRMVETGFSESSLYQAHLVNK